MDFGIGLLTCLKAIATTFVCGTLERNLPGFAAAASQLFKLLPVVNWDKTRWRVKCWDI